MQIKTAFVIEKLGERIRRGEWKTSLPPVSALAGEFGVSQGTISQALRSLEKEGLIRTLPRKGVYVAPQVDAPSKKPVIGLRGSYVPKIWSGNMTGYTGALISEIWGCANEQRSPMILLPQPEAGKPLTKAQCKSLGLDGVIFMGGGTVEEATALRIEGFPVISANHPTEKCSPLNFVDNDHEAAVREAICYLVARGHRRIGAISWGTAVPNFYEMFRPAYIEALAQAGIVMPYFSYWRSIPFLPGASCEEAIVAEVNALFSLPEIPTALICFSPLYSRMIWELFQEKGYPVEIVELGRLPGAVSEFAGFAVNQAVLAKELFNGICATVENPFHFVQKLIPMQFIEAPGERS